MYGYKNCLPILPPQDLWQRSQNNEDNDNNREKQDGPIQRQINKKLFWEEFFMKSKSIQDLPLVSKNVDPMEKF